MNDFYIGESDQFRLSYSQCKIFMNSCKAAVQPFLIESVISQSHKVEEFEKVIQERPGEMRQEKTVIMSEETDGGKRDVKISQIQKPSRKSTAPRFVSPITGMIVDQGADVVLEGIIDGVFTSLNYFYCVNYYRKVEFVCRYD